MIPAGLHLLVFGTDADRTGVFLRLAPSEVHATRWSAETELLLPIFGPEAGALAAETRGFQHDAGMAPYPLGTWDDWRNLAGEIDEGVLGRAGLRVGGLVAPSVAAEEVVGGGAVGGGQTEEGVGGLSVADGRPEGRGRVGNSEEGGGEGSAASVSATEASPVDSGAGSGGGCRGMGGGKNVAAGGGVSGERAAPAPSDLSARSEPRFAPMDPRALRADGRRGTGGRVGRELTSFLLDRSEWLAQLLREEYGGGGEEGAAGVDSAQMDFDGVAERAENAGGGTRFGREMAAPAPPAAHSPSSLTPSESSLLGDLQLSFLLFLRLACLHSLEAWKGRVHLLCSCDAALGECKRGTKKQETPCPIPCPVGGPPSSTMANGNPDAKPSFLQVHLGLRLTQPSFRHFLPAYRSPRPHESPRSQPPSLLHPLPAHAARPALLRPVRLLRTRALSRQLPPLLPHQPGSSRGQRRGGGASAPGRDGADSCFSCPAVQARPGRGGGRGRAGGRAAVNTVVV